MITAQVFTAGSVLATEPGFLFTCCRTLIERCDHPVAQPLILNRAFIATKTATQCLSRIYGEYQLKWTSRKPPARSAAAQITSAASQTIDAFVCLDDNLSSVFRVESFRNGQFVSMLASQILMKQDHEKYRGSYETSVMKRFTQFANSTHVNHDLERLFLLITLNCALRNGDAHLKNFGIVYDDVEGEARLAPVSDVVTTSVSLPNDSRRPWSFRA